MKSLMPGKLYGVKSTLTFYEKEDREGRYSIEINPDEILMFVEKIEIELLQNPYTADPLRKNFKVAIFLYQNKLVRMIRYISHPENELERIFSTPEEEEYFWSEIKEEEK